MQVAHSSPCLAHGLSSLNIAIFIAPAWSQPLKSFLEAQHSPWLNEIKLVMTLWVATEEHKILREDLEPKEWLLEM